MASGGAPPLLIVLGGLPGTGKSTVARELLLGTDLSYIRIDTNALATSGELGPAGVQGAGYLVAYAVARDLLRGGASVLAECVNPIPLTRRAWADAAAESGARLLQVELRCSDPAEHRRRIETRTVDIAGLDLPDWPAVQKRDYAPWADADLSLDTTLLSPAQAAAAVLAAIGR